MAVNKTTEFGTYHIADNPQAFQPMRTNNFRFLVYGLDRLLVVGGDEDDDNDYIKNAQEVIDFSVVSFDAPNFNQQSVQVRRGNSMVNYAGVPTWNQGNLVINDYAGVNSKSILQAWQALSYDVVNDTIPSAEFYKRDAVVMEYLPDNTLVRYWELKGCWVSSLSETGFDNENSGKKTVTAQITYDRAIPHLAD